MAATRKSVREAIARKCNDWRSVTATSDTGASVIIAADDAVESDHHFRGSDVLGYSGTIANVGAKRRVADSDSDTYAITLSRSLPSSVATNDTFHFFNIGGMGTPITTYDALINDAIMGLGAGGRMLYSWSIVTAWDQNDPEIDLPSDMTHISGVSFLDADNLVQRIDLASSGEGDWGDGWQVDTTRKSLRIVGGYNRLADGYYLTLNGAKERTLPASDSDTIDLNFDWIVLQVSAATMLQRPDQIDKNMGGIYQNQADSLRAIAVPPTPEGMIRVR